ncbi:MAG: hypothetical protein JWN65_1988 [Solirubrobacterales bacterium]|nr:hypothetical protein [Solirubrobacterales bacterium]
MYVSDDEVLEVDGVVEEGDAVPVPVPSPARGLSAPRIALPVVVQAAAVAATGFAAGAVTAAVVRAARSRRAVKPRSRSVELGPQVIATRTFLIDVHVLAPRD